MAYAIESERADSDEAFSRLTESPSIDPQRRQLPRVGIWEARDASGNAEWKRRTDIESVELWSEAESIAPRNRCCRRVVLIGESVARGFYQDPHFNPAMALQRMLGAALGEEVEVVDLARIDLVMPQLLTLIKATVLHLEPDAIVVFAGNNWHPGWAFPTGHLPEMGLQLRRSRDRASLKALVHSSLSSQLRSFVRALRTIVDASGIQVVFAIPESNLADWREAATVPVLLAAETARRWLEVRCEADEAVARGDAERLDGLGTRLLELDGGSSPAGYYLQAESALLTGDTCLARQLLRAGRDVALYWPRGFMPNIYGPVRDALLAMPAAAGITVVDLQQHLEAYCGPAALPDRRLFHDYCHLTIEGTRVCMAHVAERLVEGLGGGAPRGWEALASVEQPVAPDVLAASHLLAAAFNAHYEQAPDLVRYHLASCVEQGPAAVQLIELFADFHLRRAPGFVCDSLERWLSIVRLSNAHLLYGLAVAAEAKTLNLALIQHCVEAVSTADPGFGARVDALTRLEHGVPPSGVDLLDAAYAPEPSIRRLSRNRMSYYRAFTPISTFSVICAEVAALRLELTCRAGHLAPQRRIRIAVNGAEVASARVSQQWTRISVVVPDAHLRQGANTITVTWPPADWDYETWLDVVSDELEANITAELNPVFGEIHSFVAVVHAEAPPSETRPTSAACGANRADLAVVHASPPSVSPDRLADGGGALS